MKLKVKKTRLLQYLAIAVLVTSLLTTGTLAKYSSMFSADAALNVAAFAGGGVMDFDVGLENMIPGGTRTMQFTVQNYDGEQNCDVALEYEIQVETTGNLPLSFRLVGKKSADDDNEASVLASGLNSEMKAVGGRLPIASDEETGGRKQHTYELEITWPSSRDDEDYSREIDMVTVTVTTVQADPEAEL